MAQRTAHATRSNADPAARHWRRIRSADRLRVTAQPILVHCSWPLRRNAIIESIAYSRPADK